MRSSGDGGPLSCSANVTASPANRRRSSSAKLSWGRITPTTTTSPDAGTCERSSAAWRSSVSCVTSVMPDAGQSQAELIGSEPAPWMWPGEDGTVGVDPDMVRRFFLQDCDESTSDQAVSRRVLAPPSSRLGTTRSCRDRKRSPIPSPPRSDAFNQPRRDHSQVAARPCPSVFAGRQSSSRSARAMSTTLRRISPSRSGPWMGARSTPAVRATAA